MQAYNDFNNYRSDQSYTDQWGNPRQGSQPGFVGPPPVGGYGYEGAGGGYGYADQASMIAPPNGANWHQQQQPHQTGHYSSGTNPLGYSDYNNDYNHKASKYNEYGGKSSDMYDDQYRKKESSSGGYGPAINMISNMVSSRAAQPSRTSTRGSSRPPIPTDDMERALHYVREYSKSSPWPKT